MTQFFEKPIIHGQSTDTKPTDSTIQKGTIFHEDDTNDEYIYDGAGNWNFIPPFNLNGKRRSTLFVPYTDQTGLYFGQGSWTGINAEMLSDGSMSYKIQTSGTTVNTEGYMQLNDFGLSTMELKFIMKFKLDQIGANVAWFIGFQIDGGATSMALDVTTFISNGMPVCGIGSKTTDTNIKIYYNDNVGAVNSIDTGIPRDTDVHILTMEYITNTDIHLLLTDAAGVGEYETIISNEIPVETAVDDIAFSAQITNANTTARYYIQMYDYVYLEKLVPMPTGVTV